MRIALIFSSTEGQTRKIMQFAQKALMDEGHQTALVSADAARGMNLAPYDAAVLAGSLHAGRYQAALQDFATDNWPALNGIPTLFLSVSLAAAGDAHEDWADLGAITDKFALDTAWTPSRIEHVAGAFRYEHYGFVKYWALRWIEAKKDPDAIPGEDKEYTDWSKLESAIKDWTTGIEAGR